MASAAALELALELVAGWLGAGRLIASAGDPGADELEAHVGVLCALRGSRRWSGPVAMRMVVAINVGRSTWALRALRLSVRAHTALQARFDREFERALEAEDQWVARFDALQDQVEETERQLDERDQEYEALRERFIDMHDHAQGLDIELQALRSFAWGE
jgi:hypothetical protein